MIQNMLRTSVADSQPVRASELELMRCCKAHDLMSGDGSLFAGPKMLTQNALENFPGAALGQFSSRKIYVPGDFVG
jgi:hypothetical protein